MCRQSTHELIIGILIFVNEQYRIRPSEYLLKLGYRHEASHQLWDVVVMESDAIIMYAEIPEIVFNTSIADAACLLDFFHIPLELPHFLSKNRLKLDHTSPAEGMNGFN